ncbi:hypothetical protein RIF29_13966 [Crotalaria pallida]|uniref:B-like cyclin n=1 Tax=Crotalaria pallida TaxID=3830 RepID=A0AAN9FAX0_CROPI
MKMLCFHRGPGSGDAMEQDSLVTDEGECDESLYEFYRLDECRNILGENKIDVDMWSNMIDKLIKTHHDLQTLSQETLYLCVDMLHRFLSKTTNCDLVLDAKSKFELVALTSLMLASKYEDVDSPLCANDIEYLTELSFSTQEICDMEIVILKKLDWVLTVTTPNDFIHGNMRVLSLLSHTHDDDKMMENMVNFLSELSLTHYPIVGCYKPSLLAASAVYGARIVLGRLPHWNNTLTHCTGYSTKELSCCTKLMLKLCIATCRQGDMNILKKFSSAASVVLKQFSNRSDLRCFCNKSESEPH